MHSSYPYLIASAGWREAWVVGIWLAVFIGVAQLLLGGMGAYVSLRAPQKKNHKYWIAAFIIIGLSGAGLTAWFAKVAGHAQRVANQEIHEAELAATNTNTAATSPNAADPQLGGSGGTDINQAPPPRHLSDEQETALVSLVGTLPRDMGTKLSIVSSTDSEPMAFAKEIADIFHSRGKSQDISYSSGSALPGTFLFVPSPNDPSFPFAQLISDTLITHGIPVKSIEPNHKLKQGQIMLFIGPIGPESPHR
jgi:hypothetical protein